MKKLLNLCEVGLIKLQCKARCAVESFRSDERGVSPIVATVLTILIAVLLAAIFWTKIQEWFTAIWANVMGETIKPTP